MSRQIIDVSNLVEAIENKMISIVSIENKINVTPEIFIESLQYLNEAKLFRNGVDFFYEFSGKNEIHIDCAMKNPYLDEYFYVECEIRDGFSVEDIDKKLKETIFDKMDRKIAV